MQQLLEQYLSLLLTQLQADAAVLSTKWMIFTLVPALIYFIFCCLKWYILLAPVTLPLSALSFWRTVRVTTVRKKCGG
jgi:hypothetical protein